MSRSKVIIAFDGPDNVGKSTLIKAMKERLTMLGKNTEIVVQPSGDSTLGFIRTEVKENKVYNPFERQLLHAASHMNDLLDKFKVDVSLMDRCFVSGIVYGKLSGLNAEQAIVVNKINILTVEKFCNDNDIEFHLVVLTNEAPFLDAGEDEPVYGTLSWDGLRDMYVGMDYSKVLQGFNKKTLHMVEHKVTDEVVDSIIEKVFK